MIRKLNQLIILLRIENPNLICKFHTIGQPSEQKNQPIILNYTTIKKVIAKRKKQSLFHSSQSYESCLG